MPKKVNEIKIEAEHTVVMLRAQHHNRRFRLAASGKCKAYQRDLCARGRLSNVHHTHPEHRPRVCAAPRSLFIALMPPQSQLSLCLNRCVYLRSEVKRCHGRGGCTVYGWRCEVGMSHGRRQCD